MLESWPVIADGIAAVLLVLGAALSTVAGIGLFRFPDQLSRMHAGTKPQVLGLLLVLVALATGPGGDFMLLSDLLGWGFLVTSLLLMGVVLVAGARARRPAERSGAERPAA